VLIEWSSEMFTPEMQMINIDQAEIMLSGDIPADLVEEYYRFGLAVLSEVQNMASQIEGKAIAILGLASGLLVSLLFGTALRAFDPAKTWTALAAAMALIAVVIAAVGLMSRMWRLPSERDWFKDGLRDPARLKKSILFRCWRHINNIVS
jgi:protein-S-isoprenylcysteine O-methyltransferase Ste14